MRARSHEGNSVHLAQLKYLFPSLGWSGDLLSRQAGRWFPWTWESQLELNRRSVRNQITDIERQLKVVEKIERQSEKNVWSQVPLRLV